MRVVFFQRNLSGYFRLFENGFAALLARGHEVHVSLDDPAVIGGTEAARIGEEWAQVLSDAHGGRLTWGHTPHPESHEGWYELRRRTRLTRDYFYFLRPDFASTPWFEERSRMRAPGNAVRLAKLPGMRSGPALGAVAAVTGVMEEAFPSNPAMVAHLEALAPDVVMVSPHLMPGSMHTEIVRVAQGLGLPSVIAVASWDNLSSKQPIRVRPDVVTVWNETQRAEAQRFHGLPKGSIAVTGAHVYDSWFERTASPRETFCASVGLDPDRPFLLYLGGALFPSPITEARFALDWVRALRGSEDPLMRDVQILLRPHPTRADEWAAVDFSGEHDVIAPGSDGRMPVAADAKQYFYDSLFHSAAVAGLNTSAMIEAGIIGRRVLSVHAPEFATSQTGTIHFQYLTEVAGGLLRMAGDMPEHLAHLGATLREAPAGENPNRRFIEAFVRPHGIDRPAAPFFADAVEAAAARGRRAPQPPRRPLLRLALRPFAAATTRSARRRPAANRRLYT